MNSIEFYLNNFVLSVEELVRKNQMQRCKLYEPNFSEFYNYGMDVEIQCPIRFEILFLWRKNIEHCYTYIIFLFSIEHLFIEFVFVLFNRVPMMHRGNNMAVDVRIQMLAVQLVDFDSVVVLHPNVCNYNEIIYSNE